MIFSSALCFTYTEGTVVPSLKTNCLVDGVEGIGVCVCGGIRWEEEGMSGIDHRTELLEDS